ncbi:MAG: response regulator transcription factor [Gammaproteobacteria bacterium]|nr:response regulator transcription factor [Gammaproteobacteria bacterium]
MIKEKTRILIIESYDVIRNGLKAILDGENDFQVVGNATTCEKALSFASSLEPDVILLDLDHPSDAESNPIAGVISRFPLSKVLIYTASIDEEFHLEALRYGAVGILLKSESAELLCKAVRRIYIDNELWISRQLVSEMWKRNKYPSASLTIAPGKIYQINDANKEDSIEPVALINTLTPREKQIACLSSKGLTAKKISTELYISEKTVRNQLTVVYSKLQVKNQIELAINSHQLKLD